MGSKKVLAVPLILLWTIALSRCGGSSSSTTTSTNDGTLITLIGDTPLADVLAFRPTIRNPSGTNASVNAYFLKSSTGTFANVIAASGSFSTLIKVNVAGLRDSATVLNIASVPAGSYVQAILNLGTTDVVIYDPSQSPPIRSVLGTLSPPAPIATISPPLTITKGGTSVIRLDFSLAQSIGPDLLSGASTNVTPTLTATVLTPTVTPSGLYGFGELDAVRGFVQQVDTVSSNSSYIGDFHLQLLEGAPAGTSTGAPAIIVNVTNPAELIGVPALNALATGAFVGVNSFLDANGNFLSRSADVEHREYPEGNITGFINIEASLSGKWLELMHEIAPSVSRVAMVLLAPASLFGGRPRLMHPSRQRNIFRRHDKSLWSRAG